MKQSRFFAVGALAVVLIVLGLTTLYHGPLSGFFAAPAHGRSGATVTPRPPASRGATPVTHATTPARATPGSQPATPRAIAAPSPTPAPPPRFGWTLLRSGAAAPILDVACIDARRCLAAGSLFVASPGGTPRVIGALLSDDYGMNWRPVGATPLAHLACAGGRLCLAPADAGPLLRAADGGVSWATAQPRTNAQALSCPTTSFCAAIVGETSIEISRDGGATWRRVWSGDASLWRIDCPTASVCVAVGNAGVTYTHSAGHHWALATPLAHLPLLALACPTPTDCYATSITGELLRSQDGAASWTMQATTGVELDAIACGGRLLCLAVGRKGAAYLTRDGGVSWRRQHLPTRRDLRAVACPTPRLCYAGGSAGTLLRWRARG